MVQHGWPEPAAAGFVIVAMIHPLDGAILVQPWRRMATGFLTSGIHYTWT